MRELATMCTRLTHTVLHTCTVAIMFTACFVLQLTKIMLNQTVIPIWSWLLSMQ